MVNIDLRSAVTRTTSRVLLAAAAATAVAGLAAAPASASPASPTISVTEARTIAAVQQDESKATGKKAAPAKAASAKAAAAPAKSELMPESVSGQQTFKPSDEQRKNAEEIIKAGQKLGLPPRAWVIAVATAAQESTLHNLGDLGERNDHDSQGLFQQRPSAGWGTVKQITNPEYSATAFYKGLMEVDGWKDMSLTDAAQTVQVSAFPDHYAKWEQQATDLVLAHFGQGPYAKK